MKTSTFAQRLRAGLDARQMTQAELASRSNISKSSISHYLKGDWEGKQDAVYALAGVLDVSEAWLMGYDVPQERQSELDNPYLTVSWVIKKYREAQGYCLEEAADKLGVPADKLRKYEEEIIPIDSRLLTKMVDLYHIPEDELNVAAGNDMLTQNIKELEKTSNGLLEGAGGGTKITFEEPPLTSEQIREIKQFAKFIQERDRKNNV